MARNAELIRQWETLRDLDEARHGIAVPRLAARRGVSSRTIRRDLEALCRAGFPLSDEKINGTALWTLRGRPFRMLEAGLGTLELCALYFARTIGATLGFVFQEEADRVLSKIERALPASCRTYLAALPVLLKAKVCGGKLRTDDVEHVGTRLADAALRHRRIAMRYDSAASRRVKDYVVEPLRLCYADGGVYLTAWVPEYQEMRTFAVERIRTLAVLVESFAPRPLPSDPFADSIGVGSGPTEVVAIEFEPSTARYVREREWHRSQQITARADGSLELRMEVCVDRPLRRWILGFGPAARVISPRHLAETIAALQTAAAKGYGTRAKLTMAKMDVAARTGPRQAGGLT